MIVSVGDRSETRLEQNGHGIWSHMWAASWEKLTHQRYPSLPEMQKVKENWHKKVKHLKIQNWEGE